MTEVGRCATCRFWWRPGDPFHLDRTRGDPDGTPYHEEGWSECLRVAEPGARMQLDAYDTSGIYLETAADFGCTEHQPRDA
jgi:hypothetical protein